MAERVRAKLHGENFDKSLVVERLDWSGISLKQLCSEAGAQEDDVMGPRRPLSLCHPFLLTSENTRRVITGQTVYPVQTIEEGLEVMAAGWSGVEAGMTQKVKKIFEILCVLPRVQ